MSLGLFNCRLIQPARDQLFFFAGCLAAPVPVRASSVQSPCDASCSAPTIGRARHASCVCPSQEGFVLVFRWSEAPVGCRRVHPTDSPTNSPEDPPILPIDSAIEPLLVVTAVSAALFHAPTLSAQAGGELPAYLDPKRLVEERIGDLMSRMTLKEKVGQLNLPCVYVNQLGKDIPSKMEACRRFAAGTYTQEIGPGCGFFTLAIEILHNGARRQADSFNELQKIALTQTRLKIPLLEDEEGTHGAMFSGATIFPEGLAIGSTFDFDLVRSVYAAAAAEARAVGIHMLSTLVLELDRDPRMGRNEEAYTEDPYLYSRIAEGIVQGTQGTNIAAADKVIAVLTDFPTQSEPASGLERGAIELSERALRENFLLPWTAAITKAGALGVMAGYPEIEDVPAHASEKWMNGILRQELGFRGVVESEGGGFGTLIYEHIVRTQKEAGALALKAGVDLDITYEPAYMGPLIENVEEGRGERKDTRPNSN